MKITTRNLHLTLATLACLAVATGASAAEVAVRDSVAAASRNEPQIQELDEVLVRGGRLRDAIVDAEDDFFKLYNQLNKNSDFTTSCIFASVQADSQIKSRFCIPGFMADAMADQVYFSEQCKAAAGSPAGTTCYTPPTPQQVLMERKLEYANYMMKVIRSDPRLGDKAGHLDDLYHELVSVQQQYIKIKAVGSAGRAPSQSTVGPRQQ